MDIRDKVREVSSWSLPHMKELGGNDAIGRTIMFSKNLGNASHFNFKDKSVSIAIWAETKPGNANNWYFVLPNLSITNS